MFKLADQPELVMIKSGEEETALQIERLTNRRQRIYEKLFGLQEALKALYRKEVTYGDIEKYLNAENERQAQGMALEKWFLLEEIKVEIDFYNNSGVTIPEEVKNVVAAWREAHSASKDPSRYWSDTKQAFKALPVTKEERENIEKRNQRFCTDPELAKLRDLVETHVNIFNYTNRFCEISINPAKIRDNAPWIFPFIQSEETENFGYRGFKRHKFTIKSDVFLQSPFRYFAFEE